MKKLKIDKPSEGLFKLKEIRDLFIYIINFVDYDTLKNIVLTKNKLIFEHLFTQKDNIPNLTFEIRNFVIDNKLFKIGEWLNRSSYIIFKLCNDEFEKEIYPIEIINKLALRLRKKKYKKICLYIDDEYKPSTKIFKRTILKYFNHLLKIINKKTNVYETNIIILSGGWIPQSQKEFICPQHLQLLQDRNKRTCMRFGTIDSFGNRNIISKIPIYKRLEISFDSFDKGIYKEAKDFFYFYKEILDMFESIPLKKLKYFKLITPRSFNKLSLIPSISLKSFPCLNTLKTTISIFKEIVCNNVTLHNFSLIQLNEYFPDTSTSFNNIELYSNEMWGAIETISDNLKQLEYLLKKLKCNRLDLGNFNDIKVINSIIQRIIWETKIKYLHFHLNAVKGENEGEVENYKSYNPKIKIKIHFLLGQNSNTN